MQNLNENIKILCRKNNISIYQLEDNLGFSRNTIYQWNKRTPGIDKVQAVAEYFQTDINQLVNSQPNETLIERITRLAKKQNLSVADLAIKLGLSRTSIYAWKKSSPKAETLEIVADYFGVSVDYLLNRQTPNVLLSKDAQQIAKLYDSFDAHTQKVIKKLFQSLDEKPI